jgi:cyclase
VLKTRIIPTLLWKGPGLVKGVAFDSWRRIGTAMPAVKVFNGRDVDELVLLDITATEEHRDLDYATVADLAAECFVPFRGGGSTRWTRSGGC